METTMTIYDYRLPGTTSSPYEVHKAVYALAGGETARPLYAQFEDGVIIRSLRPINLEYARPVPAIEFANGDVLGFDLVAAVSKSNAGQRKFVHSHDIAYRRQWLASRASTWGFDVLLVEVSARKEMIDKPGSAPFAIDRSTFRGTLRVTDSQKLHDAMKNGLGWCKAWGRGLIFLTRNEKNTITKQ
jgi:CRISPR associated protein